ncbi:putative Integrase-type DNA-binding superfamily protein [Hibiscus syriacus]|uniref:Integrase-type DNA-binding superfamily protein n=1 Tax=Hibiscus syriacus TaxID=106335 RepID=A0A6A2XWB7_HIBSY|nr:proline-rich protein 3-like [Hibiscus syriacus]KAE8660597.1 putative Integrase-type DNA-binding superfamily protein [Hibiscus syriacus]
MALTRLSLAFSLIVLSFLAIASAGDYSDASSKYGFDGIPADSPQAKPEEAEEPQHGTKPVYNEKPGHGDASSKYGFDGIPADSPQAKPEEEKKPNYGSNQYTYNPKPYGTKPEEMKNRLSIAVQGTVLCKEGSKYYPIQGALATIACKAVDEVGVQKTISICSKPTDEKGYFFVPLSDSGRDKLKLRECKAHLKSSPLETCNVPSNVNKAIEGAFVSAFRVLNEKKSKLYSVGPFFYTSRAKPAPKHGY